MPVAGVRGTLDWGADERPKNFRENILFFQPNGNSPIFALTGKAGKKKVNDPEFSWWNEGQTLVRLQVEGALASGDTLVTVDSPDPTSSTMGANRGLAGNLKAGDILLVEPATDAEVYDQEHVMVDTVLSDTQFTIRRGFGGTTPAAISDEGWLLLIGSAYAEGTGAPRAVTRNPIKNSNYTQIFKNTYELTGTADKTEARTGSPWSNDKKRKSYDHARDIELAILFGRKAEATGDNGKPIRSMGGLRSFIPAANTHVFSGATTPQLLIDALAPMFDWDTGAGDSRMMFMGNGAAIALSKIFADEVTFNVNNVVKVYGMSFQEFILPMGRVLMKIHPLLSRHPLYTNSAFGVDFDALKYVHLNGRDTKTFDDVQTKDEDVRRGYIMTEASIMVDYGGLTMSYLGNINYVAP